MPELPEVEMLRRHLEKRIVGQSLRECRLFRRRILGTQQPKLFLERLIGARCAAVRRRGKYLILEWKHDDSPALLWLHLGMTGRLYFAPDPIRSAKEGSACWLLNNEWMVFQDKGGLGWMGLGEGGWHRLGPEPLGADFDLCLEP